MIEIMITREGDIHVTKDADLVAEVAAEDSGEIRPEQDIDDNEARFFQSGWDAAVREAKMSFINNRILEFFNETGGESFIESVPDLTGSVLQGWQDAEVSTPLPSIRHAANSGEPELEMNQTYDPANTGTWTMSSDELQSRLDESYQRGLRDAKPQMSPPMPMVTSEATLAVIALEISGELSTRRTQRNSDQFLRNFTYELAQRLGYEVTR